jgi:hypothetical protein
VLICDPAVVGLKTLIAGLVEAELAFFGWINGKRSSTPACLLDAMQN